MKVSVSIVTYEQESFVEEAVQSVLDQETDFDVEIIIGDDASTDGTRDILRRMADDNPGRIKLLLHKTNPGDRGLTNVMSTIDAAQGEYIAFLDGDDCWSARHKLQRMVDFLDAHPECALAAHRTAHLVEGGETILSPRPTRGDSVLPLGRLIVSNCAEKIATVVRTSAARQVPDWYRTTPAISADWIFNVMAGATSGNFGYVDEVMAGHRIHADSITMRFGNEKMLASKRESLKFLRGHLPGYRRSLFLAMLTVTLKQAAQKLSPAGYQSAKRRTLGGSPVDLGSMPTRLK
ncbi:MAG: glycosyltransferase [Pseudomonadota bacterium]